MKRFKTLIIIVIISFTICAVVAWVIDRYIELPGPTLQTLTNVITVFTSIILFAAGFALYQKFSSSQALIDKQTEKIIELLTFMSALNFSVEVIGNNLERYIFNLHITGYKKRRKSFIIKGVDLREFKNVFNYSLFGMLQKLEEFARNPYLPKSVAAKIAEKIAINSAGVLVPPKDKLFIVNVRGQFAAAPPESIGSNGETSQDFVSLYETINNENFYTEDLMYKLETIYSAALNWLTRNNTAISDTLNIEKIEPFDRKKDIR